MRFVSGTASGAALVVVGHPLDTLRVLLQTSPPGAARETSLVALAARLLRTEGVRGFYRGFAANLLRVAPQSALTLVVYEEVKRALNRLDPARA